MTFFLFRSSHLPCFPWRILSLLASFSILLLLSSVDVQTNMFWCFLRLVIYPIVLRDATILKSGLGKRQHAIGVPGCNSRNPTVQYAKLLYRHRHVFYLSFHLLRCVRILFTRNQPKTLLQLYNFFKKKFTGCFLLYSLVVLQDGVGCG